MSERSERIRLGTPPPYADYLPGLNWPGALDVCDSFIRDARAWGDEELTNGVRPACLVTWPGCRAKCKAWLSRCKNAA